MFFIGTDVRENNFHFLLERLDFLSFQICPLCLLWSFLGVSKCKSGKGNKNKLFIWRNASNLIRWFECKQTAWDIRLHFLSQMPSGFMCLLGQRKKKIALTLSTKTCCVMELIIKRTEAGSYLEQMVIIIKLWNWERSKLRPLNTYIIRDPHACDKFLCLSALDENFIQWMSNVENKETMKKSYLLYLAELLAEWFNESNHAKWTSNFSITRKEHRVSITSSNVPHLGSTRSHSFNLSCLQYINDWAHTLSS